jgi:cbb3-type cytochrome oxidase maturation protein
MGASLWQILDHKFEAVQVIFLLILIGVLVAGGFLGAFLWALNAGQFDDTTTPPIRLSQEDSAIVSSPEERHPKEIERK